MNEPLYKLLEENGLTTFGRSGWDLPRNSKPGKWMPQLKGSIVLCSGNQTNAYHLLRFRDLLEWSGPNLFEVQTKGLIISSYNKVGVRQVRLIQQITTWNQKNLRLLAADYAYHVLKFFERKHPNNKKPREAIRAARAFARGRISPKTMVAASDAARYAARYAARNAASYAADAASDAASYAASYAADAASDAASYAASDAGYAASDAARDAASDASYAASDAADAGYAASTERQWQLKRLSKYLEIPYKDDQE